MNVMTPSEKSPNDRSFLLPGGKTGLLLVHCLGGTPVEMRFVAQGLNRAGYTVLCAQLAGHCAGEDELRDSHPEQWYKSLETALAMLRERCDVVVVGGQCMGGLLALHLAHERPDQVDGLVLYAPTLKLNGWAIPRWARFLNWIKPIGGIKTRFRVPDREPHGIKDERVRAVVVKLMQSGDTTAAGFCATPLRTVAHFNKFSAKVRKEFPRVKTPTLIVHAREDDIADPNNAFRIARRLGGPVDLTVLDDSFHFITLDQQRHVVVDRTLAFTQRIERAERGIETQAPAAVAHKMHRVVVG